MSNLGDRFKVRDNTFLVGTRETEVSVGSWHLDDLVTEKIRGAIGTRAVRVPYRKEA